MPNPVPVPYGDNYAYLCPAAPGRCLVVDPGHGAAVAAALAGNGLLPEAVFLTHGHADHTAGLRELQQDYHGIPVYAAGGLKDGETLPCLDALVLLTPGHSEDSACLLTAYGLFCGDTLFGAGCGRVLTGDYARMLASLERIADLEPDTALYFGHEYTPDNLEFAALVEPDNPGIRDYRSMVAACGMSVPGFLGRELMANPFLRCHVPAVQAFARKKGAAGSAPLEVFTALRKAKDNF